MPAFLSCSDDKVKRASQEGILELWADMLRPIRVRNVLTSGTKGVGGGMRGAGALRRWSWRVNDVDVGIDTDGFKRRGASVKDWRSAMACGFGDAREDDVDGDGKDSRSWPQSQDK